MHLQILLIVSSNPERISSFASKLTDLFLIDQPVKEQPAIFATCTNYADVHGAVCLLDWIALQQSSA
jgi:hypothetical protein